MSRKYRFDYSPPTLALPHKGGGKKIFIVAGC
jgi:hypothetical protein